MTGSRTGDLAGHGCWYARGRGGLFFFFFFWVAVGFEPRSTGSVSRINNRLTARPPRPRNKYVPISEHDIRKICDGKVNVIPYSLLETMYKSSQPITQLFKPEFNNCVVLLYQLQGTLGVGHWVALIFVEDTGIINFFNPYGLAVDQEIDLMTHSDLYLTKLLKQSRMRVNVNKFRFQVLKDDISTCSNSLCV